MALTSDSPAGVQPLPVNILRLPPGHRRLLLPLRLHHLPHCRPLHLPGLLRVCTGGWVGDLVLLHS
jgi:hypothetical protein